MITAENVYFIFKIQYHFNAVFLWNVTYGNWKYFSLTGEVGLTNFNFKNPNPELLLNLHVSDVDLTFILRGHFCCDTLHIQVHKELLEKRDYLMEKDPIKSIKSIEGPMSGVKEEKLASTLQKRSCISSSAESRISIFTVQCVILASLS